MHAEARHLQEVLSDLRGALATAVAKAHASLADADRERAVADQRVGDLRETHAQLVADLRAELAVVRTEAQEQRTRADRAGVPRSLE